MASHRIGPRLSRLSPEQLVAFVDEQASPWSAAALRVAEEDAARMEQPEWVLSELLPCRARPAVQSAQTPHCAGAHASTFLGSIWSCSSP